MGDHDEPDFAARLQFLFDVVHPPGEPPLSSRAVAARVRRQGGSIAFGYIDALRTGKRTNPGFSHVVALARAFGVPVGYFADRDVYTSTTENLARLKALADGQRPEGVVELIARTASLSNDDGHLRDVLKKAFDAMGSDDG